MGNMIPCRVHVLFKIGSLNFHQISVSYQAYQGQVPESCLRSLRYRDVIQAPFCEFGISVKYL